MVGDLPSDLFRVQFLEVIDLHGNKFSGLLPSDVAEDNNMLTFLALYDNELTGSIPTQLGLIDQLVHLDLSTNGLGGDIPTELGNLSNLGSLFLAENQFNTGPIPSFVYTLKTLEELSLKSSRRTGSISESIATLSNLKFLDLDNNTLTGSIPSQIGSLSNLEFLLLNRNTLSQEVPIQLGTLENLRKSKVRKFGSEVWPLRCRFSRLLIQELYFRLFALK
jgi:Leucine-rich repeat (LRR) protein